MAPPVKTKIKFFTYNVWSREHVAVYRRICAISELIEQHDPDVTFLHVTSSYLCILNVWLSYRRFHTLFQEASWWTQYRAFSSKDKKQSESWIYTSQVPQHTEYACLMLSKLCVEEVVYHAPSPPCYPTSPQSSPRSPPRVADKSQTRRAVAGPLPPDLLSNCVYNCTEETMNFYFCVPPIHEVRAATCCLLGPTPSDVRSMHRRGRAALFLEHFDINGCRNVVLGGDLSWDDDVDGPLPLGNRWVDAWSELRDGEGPGGWTYDAVANPMLRGCKPERKRPDRFVCKLTDFRLESIEMVGVEPIPGVTHCDDKGNELPRVPEKKKCCVEVNPSLKLMEYDRVRMHYIIVTASLFLVPNIVGSLFAVATTISCVKLLMSVF
ncbi:hypothetical protein ACQ4PT_026339 [Festuca glaucescens]